MTPAFQFFIIIIGSAWIFPFVLAWVRFDRLPHAKYAFVSLFSAPLILLDEFLVAFNFHTQAVFLLGVFDFVPVLIAVLAFLSVQKMVLEHTEDPKRHLLVVVLFALGQTPFLLMTPEAKIALSEMSIVGELALFWHIYLYQFLTAIVVLVYTAFILMDLSEHKSHLKEHAVDLHFYNLKPVSVMFSMMLAVAITAIVTVLVVAFDLRYISLWQSGLAMLYSVSLWLALMALVGKRLYAPAPFGYVALKKATFPEQQLKMTLARAEEVIVQSKGYRKKGIRLKHLSDAANLTPIELAVATKTLQNRDFREFIFHYRLEYAKVLLTQTDAKVSTVARKLGFHSDKYLSELFEEYVESLTPKEPVETDEHY